MAEFVVAFSGGSDSLALLSLVSSLYPGSVTAVYVDHGLRSAGELARERELNEENCRRLGVPLIIRTVDRKALEGRAREKGTEAAAREARYALLLEECRERGAVLLTAHTRDDQEETVAMRLSQGADYGHLAIPARGEKDGVVVIRPLLAATRAELRSYLKARNFTWSEDSTNCDTRILRNRFRLVILPRFFASFPGARDALDWLAMDSSLVRLDTERAIGNVTPGILTRKQVDECPPRSRRELIYAVLGSKERVSGRYIDDILKAVQSDDGPWTRENGEFSVVFRSGVLRVIPRNIPSAFVTDDAALVKGGTIRLPLLDFTIRPPLPGDDPLLLRIDPGRLARPVLRSPLPGDAIRTAGGNVSVSSLLSSWKIPEGLRSSVPVLEDREGIAAVFGRWAGGRDRLRPSLKSLAPGVGFVYYSKQRKIT